MLVLIIHTSKLVKDMCKISFCNLFGSLQLYMFCKYKGMGSEVMGGRDGEWGFVRGYPWTVTTCFFKCYLVDYINYSFPSICTWSIIWQGLIHPSLVTYLNMMYATLHSSMACIGAVILCILYRIIAIELKVELHRSCSYNEAVSEEILYFILIK